MTQSFPFNSSDCLDPWPSWPFIFISAILFLRTIVIRAIQAGTVGHFYDNLTAIDITVAESIYNLLCIITIGFEHGIIFHDACLANSYITVPRVFIDYPDEGTWV